MSMKMKDYDGKYRTKCEIAELRKGLLRGTLTAESF
jgi:hypothetical protein